MAGETAARAAAWGAGAAGRIQMLSVARSDDRHSGRHPAARLGGTRAPCRLCSNGPPRTAEGSR